MCGELDENLLINQEILQRFTAMAQAVGVQTGTADSENVSGPQGLSSSDGRAKYMDKLFNQNLARSLTDVGAVGEEETVDAIASQAIAFARLAGFIAGQLPPEADLYRTIIEAMSEGHSEPRRIMEARRREHDHHHGHSHEDEHSHDDGHGHHHH